MKYWILFSIATIICFLIYFFIYQNVDNKKIDEKELFDLIQEFRSKNDLTPYNKSEIICNYAAIRLSEIRDNFSHDGFKNLEHPPCTKDICSMGENLAQGQESEKELLAAWLNSPSHAKNLYRDFEYSCIKTDGVHTVHFFGTY